MQTEPLAKVALATLCVIAAVLAFTLIARGLISGLGALAGLAAGGG
jgi:hypothetical protein